ncbi:MAG: hypothetical protein AB7V42_01110 [Thermoleophilia bacterium]
MTRNPQHPTGSGALAVWAPCATCWGQRRILTAGPDHGDALVAVTCPTCLGIGEHLVAARTSTLSRES